MTSLSVDVSRHPLGRTAVDAQELALLQGEGQPGLPIEGAISFEPQLKT
jgi:hypothetical protein